MASDPWHYSRADLAGQILGMFESGLSTALVFFAPRRMGKTEFLCKDIMPLAISKGWKVFYFSFLDLGGKADYEFARALKKFAHDNSGKTRHLFRHVSKVTGAAAGISGGIEFNQIEEEKNIKEVITELASKGKVLLMMDEVQALAQKVENETFIASLRTALDLNKDNIKVIFTGSSQAGLRRMFSEAKAPFFHFGQNLPFPELQQDFTNHLADMFATVTKRKLDKEILWHIFQEMQKIPQLVRSLVERIALNPTLTIEEAKNLLLADVFEGRAFAEKWDHCSALEKTLLKDIANDRHELFSTESRKRFSTNLGIADLTASSVQSVLKALQRKELIGQSTERGNYYVDDPNFKRWIQQRD